MKDDLRQSSGSTTYNSGASFTGTGTTDNAELICGCPEPGPETIQVEQVLGAEMSQKVVEFDMFVPSQKPDIKQVIDVYVKDVEINSVDVIPNKVIIRGDLEVKVMYVADLENEPVHAFERKHVRFTRDIEVEGAERDMDASADVTVEYVDYDFHRHHDKRKVHITIVLKFWARVITTTEMDVYALSPITEVGQVEYTSANALENGYSTGLFGGEATSASQTGGGDIAAYGSENMLITGPGITPTAGTMMGISGTGTINGTSVNIRTGPGTNFPIVTKVNKDTTVTIKEQAFGWYKIALSDGTTGWVASWLINGNTGVPKG
ncbi:SPOCS domain-containing protein [Pelosinus sp. sgz500959]|uniref:SPOCS domain-containing protein n=1 Tax=Pelosinus sp. sgz500959 TaxID=3242472 RepID=UPI00366B2E46